MTGPYSQRPKIWIGKHSLYYEDPGIAVMAYDGPMSADEMRRLCDIPDVEEHGNKFQLTLTDMTKFGGLDTAARKVGAQRLRPAVIYYTAYVNATFGFQVIVGMWNRAANILQGPKNVAEFFSDTDSARAWLLKKYELHTTARHSQPPPAR